MKVQPWQLDIQAYDFVYALTPLYAHLDTQRHVNNVSVQSFYLEGRIRFLMYCLGEQAWFSDDVLLRPERTATSYLQETYYLSDVQCAVKLISVEENRFRLALALFQQNQCVGVQDCVVGAWAGERWVSIPEDICGALAPRLGHQVTASELLDLSADEEQLKRCPRRGEVLPRFADLDPDLQLSELSLARYFEQSRSGALRELRMPGLGLLVAHVDIRYVRWLKGMGEIRLPCAVKRIGNSSFVLGGATKVNDELIAVAESVMVMIDLEARRPTPIPAEVRSAMAESMAE